MLVLALSLLAWSQEVPDLDAQLYRLPVDSASTLWADDTSLAESGTWSGRFGMGYARNPLVYRWDNGDQNALISDVLDTHLLGAYTHDRFRAALDVPLYLFANTPDGGQVGLGDVALDLKARWLERGEGTPGVALGIRLSAPTTTVDTALGSPGLGYALELIVDQQVGPVLLAANLGTAGVPKAELENILWNDALVARLGAGYAVSDTAGISLDFAGRMNYSEALRNEAGSPAEVLLGGYGRPTGGNLVLRGGVGTGISSGIGAPSFRSVLALGYEPAGIKDADLDGIGDKVDACPAFAEDLDGFEDADGCPETDNDRDGLTDGVDACPAQAEDIDGFKDDDGCPEADNDEDGVADATDACPAVAEDQDGYKDGDGCPELPIKVQLRLEGPDHNPVPAGVATLTAKEQTLTGGSKWKLTLEPGTYAVKAEAPGYEGLTAELIVPDDRESFEASWTLKPLVVMGTVKVKVADPAGKPVEGARWSFGTEEPLPITGGLGTKSLTPGMHNMTVRADGYKPVTFPVEVHGNEEITLPVTLQPSKVQITREKIDIADKVYFETGSATIKATSHALLKEIATLILDHPEITKLRVEGHTDSRGNDAANLQLSKDRAASVAAFFAAQGIAADRLESEGYGETRPIDPAENKVAWEKNRRVEFFIAARADEE